MSQRPDERFTLAAERTFLAWMRTALGLMAGGVALIGLVPDFSEAWVRTVLGLFLLVLGSASAATGLQRWLQVRRALQSGGPMPDSRPLWLLAGVLVTIGLVGAVATAVAALQ